MGILLFVCLVLLTGCSSKEKAEEPEEEAADTSVSTSDVVWNGKGYNYNEHISNFLFLGIDRREFQETEGRTMEGAGQSDAIYLIAWDRVDNDITLISIPRDTMTDIEVLALDGKSLGYAKNHLSIAYAYGDGKYQSCELARDAVSNLFYGLPIQGYCALNLDGMGYLAEAVDGVEVTVPNDSLEEKYPEYSMGSTVRIDQENIELFLRSRDTEVSHSAISRMERQQAFLEAFAERAQEKYKERPGIITEMYTGLQDYMVTNMGTDQFAKLMECMASGEKDRWTVPGEPVVGERFDEYHVDDGALYEKIIQTFYAEVTE